jgi:hypothetical protein
MKTIRIHHRISRKLITYKKRPVRNSEFRKQWKVLFTKYYDYHCGAVGVRRGRMFFPGCYNILPNEY